MPQIPTVTGTERAAGDAWRSVDAFFASLPSVAVILLLVLICLWALLWFMLPFVVWFMWGNLQAIRRNTQWLCQHFSRHEPPRA